jgi:hypothetical protein
MASAADGRLRVIAIALVGALGAVGLATPSSLLVGGAAWLGFLVCVMSGWGYLVARIARVQAPDLGLRAAWGMAGYLAVAGPLIALGVFSLPIIFVTLGAGVAGFAWRELVTPTASLPAAYRGLRFLRQHPVLATVVVVLGLAALVQILGAATALDRNRFDDDIIYTPMIRRLLDVGDLIEPFSFRRLAAYGGQTALGALAGARGTLVSMHLLDQGLMFAIALLLLVGHARERGIHDLWTSALVLFLLVLPNIGVNTAAHWSGVVLFSALYRTALRTEWVLVGVVAAAICTLRQNFIPVVVIFVLALLAFRMAGTRKWSEERRAWLRVTVAGTFALLPWCIAAFVSSDTFLYPIFGGTWNPELTFRPPTVTWLDEVAYVAWACIDTAPIRLTAVLFAVLVVTPDLRPGRPLKALLIASAIGLVLLARSTAEASDPGPVWRYAFGFSVPLACFLAIEACRNDEHGVPMLPVARWLVLAVCAFQLVLARTTLPERYASLLANLSDAVARPRANHEARRYAAMQASIPVGAKVAVMLDDAWLLDFKRNDIANLDTIGFASPGARLPTLVGAEPIRAYLLAEGYRYVAFVRADRSRTYYQRAFWLKRYFSDDNRFYQMLSVYQLAAIEAFAELATTTRVVYDADGLVVLDLGTPLRTASSRAGGDEPTRRTAFLTDVARREGLLDALSLTSRGDVEILDGVSPLLTPPSRGLNRRAHLRVRGRGTMRLVVRASVNTAATATRPQLDVSLDGTHVTTVIADAEGRYVVDLVTPPLAPGWHDVYLVFASAFEPGRSGRDPRVARLEAIEWGIAR